MENLKYRLKKMFDSNKTDNVVEQNKKVQLHLQKSKYLMINHSGNDSNQSVGLKFLKSEVVD